MRGGQGHKKVQGHARDELHDVDPEQNDREAAQRQSGHIAGLLLRVARRKGAEYASASGMRGEPGHARIVGMANISAREVQTITVPLPFRELQEFFAALSMKLSRPAAR
ncbi:hypothetical protein GCM10027056_17320 [Glaciibacter psychrotolerans]